MWINPTNQTVYTTHSEVRAAFPNVSMPANLTDEIIESVGFAPIASAAPGHNPATHAAVETAPALVDGVWTQQWAVTDLAPEVIASNLAAAKIAKNAQINEWRAQANQTSFTHSGKQIACDALSRSDIDAVAGSIALSGAFPVGFPGAWKAMDNTYLMLPDVDAFKAMYASMTLQGTINFGQSQTLKTALAAATTIAEVNAIAWE